MRVGAVFLGDVGQVDERRQLLVAGSGPRDHQAVAAVVAVERLVVVDGARVLGPELHLVEVEFRRLEVALGRVDEVGVHGQAVEVPRAVREFLDAGELARPRSGERPRDRRSSPEGAGSAARAPLGPRPARRGARNPSTSAKPRSRTSSRVASETRISIGHIRPAAPVRRLPRPPRLRSADARGRCSTWPTPRSRPRWPRSPSPSSPALHGRGSRCTTGGICGSDLHLFAHNTGPSPTLVSIGTFPFVLGHETAGTGRRGGTQLSRRRRDAESSSTPASRACPVASTRPAPTAPAAGRRPASTSTAALSARGGRSGTPRTSAGDGRSSVLAHDSMLHPIPDAIAERGASLYEPVSIACHGLLRAPPVDGEPVLDRRGRHHRAWRPSPHCGGCSRSVR